MVSAVGSVGSGATVGRSVGAGPELAQLEKQLSDCVNCESAKTPRGQAEIAQLNARIAAVKDRQVRTEPVTQPSAPSLAPKSMVTTLGGQLDVYA